MWGFGPFGGLFHAWWAMANSLFWVAVVVLVFMVIGRNAPRHAGGPFWRGSAALDILEQRYARGEIGRDEYLQKKNDLLDRGPASPGP